MYIFIWEIYIYSTQFWGGWRWWWKCNCYIMKSMINICENIKCRQAKIAGNARFLITSGGGGGSVNLLTAPIIKYFSLFAFIENVWRNEPVNNWTQLVQPAAMSKARIQGHRVYSSFTLLSSYSQKQFTHKQVGFLLQFFFNILFSFSHWIFWAAEMPSWLRSKLFCKTTQNSLFFFIVRTCRFKNFTNSWRHLPEGFTKAKNVMTPTHKHNVMHVHMIFHVHQLKFGITNPWSKNNHIHTHPQTQIHVWFVYAILILINLHYAELKTMGKNRLWIK